MELKSQLDDFNEFQLRALINHIVSSSVTILMKIISGYKTSECEKYSERVRPSQ